MSHENGGTPMDITWLLVANRARASSAHRHAGRNLAASARCARGETRTLRKNVGTVLGTAAAGAAEGQRRLSHLVLYKGKSSLTLLSVTVDLTVYSINGVTPV